MSDNTPIGRVVSLHAGDNGDQVIVEIEAGAICARCAAGKGCGAGLLGASPGSKRVAAKIANDTPINCGDRVSLELRPVSVLQGAIIAYGYPLGGAVFAAIVSATSGLDDALSVAAVLLGLTIGFLFAKARVRNEKCLQRFTPVVTKLYDSASARR